MCNLDIFSFPLDLSDLANILTQVKKTDLNKEGASELIKIIIENFNLDKFDKHNPSIETAIKKIKEKAALATNPKLMDVIYKIF